MLKVYLILTVLGVMGGISYAGYSYVTGLSDKLEQKEKLIVTQSSALETNMATIASLKADMVITGLALDKLSQDLRSSEESVSALRKILAEHDLTALSLEKPALIERRINDATKRVFSDLERVTTP